MAYLDDRRLDDDVPILDRPDHSGHSGQLDRSPRYDIDRFAEIIERSVENQRRVAERFEQIEAMKARLAAMRERLDRYARDADRERQYD